MSAPGRYPFIYRFTSTMLTYNTHLKPLVLPEYGRNIQQMVDFCKTIEDRDERNNCARSIIVAMRTLLPQTGDPEETQRKLWDHLAIMSGFDLDVDYPFDVVREETLRTDPDKLSTAPNYIPRRHYGLHIERLVEIAASMEPGLQRDALILLIASQMKKLRLVVNPEGVDDAKVFEDLAEMSRGAIVVEPESVRLHEYEMADLPLAPKKKRKRKK